MADIDSLKQEYRSNLTQCLRRVKTELDNKASADDLTALQTQVNTIDANLHTHDNKEVLDLLSESAEGKLQYNGVAIGGDTEVKSDIAKLNTDKQDKTDNTLTTTDKTITGAINEVNGNLLDTVGFSADYKNIILNRKSGLNPYTIPIAAIINNASLTELKDIDSTGIGNGKTLVYDSSTQKHRYVDTTGTDEFVKMDSTADASYLSDLIDKSTVVNDNGVLKVKKLDGQEVTITEINYLKGLTMNVMDLVNTFANGGVKVLNTPVNTYADLSTLDRSTFIEGISYIVYVLADETHAGAKTTYLVDKTNTTFFGNADSQRNFTTNPIDLANEVTGKLGTSNIDVDSLWTLLTINDTYKTLTATDNVFGTHGAKAMYDELTTSIGAKANATDLTTHTEDTTNDSGYITKTVENLTNYYLKSELYTQKEVNEIIGNINRLDSKIVDTLPTENISTTTIYLIKVGDTSNYTQHMYIDSAWAELGTTQIDLTDYYNKTQADSKFATKETVETHTNDTDIHVNSSEKSLISKIPADKNVCSTNVSDVGETNISYTLPSSIVPYGDGTGFNIKCVVKNGIANVVFCWLISSAKAITKWTTIASTLPKPMIQQRGFILPEKTIDSKIQYSIKTSGELEVYIAEAITTVDWFKGSITYPVAES